jgi:hypothetical protein
MSTVITTFFFYMNVMVKAHYEVLNFCIELHMDLPLNPCDIGEHLAWSWRCIHPGCAAKALSSGQARPTNQRSCHDCGPATVADTPFLLAIVQNEITFIRKKTSSRKVSTTLVEEIQM